MANNLLDNDEAYKTQDVLLDTAQIKQQCKESLDMLCAVALPAVYKYPFPPLFLAIWQWLLENVHKYRDFSKLALGMPRGFSKTTIIKLLCLYVILFTKKQFILIVSESAPKAVNIIADIMDMLAEPNIIKLFGDYKIAVEIDRQDLRKFNFQGRNIIIAGIGSQGDPRGLNLKNRRPDLIIFDDVQSREVADSQVQSEALERWIIGTVMKAKSPEGCLFIFVANMYPTKYSILRKLKSNPSWIKFIVGGILANGESLWEELFPLTQLIEEYETDLHAGHPEIFFAEVLNDENAASTNLIDISKLPTPTYEPGDIHQGNFIVIDPSTGKTNGDSVAIGYFEVHTKPIMLELANGKFSPGETIRKALTMALNHNCKLIAVESVAYQSTLNYWMQFISQQLGITGIDFVEIYPGRQSKTTRILNMFRQLMQGDVYFHQQVRSEVLNEIVQFNALKTDNTDNILDLLTYPHKVMELYPAELANSITITQQESEAIEVLPIEATSYF